MNNTDDVSEMFKISPDKPKHLKREMMVYWILQKDKNKSLKCNIKDRNQNELAQMDFLT